MKPSPEIVTLPGRPHFRPWGDVVALPLLFAIIGFPLVGLGVYLALRPGARDVGIACSLAFGLSLSIAFPIALRVAIARRRQLVKDLRALEARADFYAADLDDPSRRPGALYRLAQFAFLRASRRGGWFDVGVWERATGDRCPRTIITVDGIDLSRPAEDVTEEIDVESESSVPRRALLRDINTAAILAAIGVALWATGVPNGQRLLGGLAGAGALVALALIARRAGWRPVAIRSTLVSPRGIETGGLAGSRAFTVRDSMLFLFDRNEDGDGGEQRLTILLLRADGAQRTIRLTGRDDPRIPGIVARWTAGAEAGRVPSRPAAAAPPSTPGA
jgi:hypothetical protein